MLWAVRLRYRHVMIIVCVLVQIQASISVSLLATKHDSMELSCVSVGRRVCVCVTIQD
jgi:hypothetical protein